MWTQDKRVLPQRSGLLKTPEFLYDPHSGGVENDPPTHTKQKTDTECPPDMDIVTSSRLIQFKEIKEYKFFGIQELYSQINALHRLIS